MKKVLLCLSFLVLLVTISCSKKEYDVFSTLHGIVSDNDTGDPVSGVNVVLSPSGLTKLTGTDGYFEFQNLTPEQYTITVQKSGYITNRKSINAISGENNEVNITIIKQK